MKQHFLEATRKPINAHRRIHLVRMRSAETNYRPLIEREGKLRDSVSASMLVSDRLKRKHVHPKRSLVRELRAPVRAWHHLHCLCLLCIRTLFVFSIFCFALSKHCLLVVVFVFSHSFFSNYSHSFGTSPKSFINNTPLLLVHTFIPCAVWNLNTDHQPRRPVPQLYHSTSSPCLDKTNR